MAGMSGAKKGMETLTGADLQAIDLYRGDCIAWADVPPAARVVIIAEAKARKVRES